jgi:CRP-like cAMP-binding protein
VPGEAFGELALMYNAPRAASIVTRKPGKLLTLDRATFSQVLKVGCCIKKIDYYQRRYFQARNPKGYTNITKVGRHNIK